MSKSTPQFAILVERLIGITVWYLLRRTQEIWSEKRNPENITSITS